MSSESASLTVRSHWDAVGQVKLHGSGHRVVMPAELPSGPGVYKILWPETMAVYVGEGRQLGRRLRNYENAGYMPGKFARTNRMVQGLIYEALISESSVVDVIICTRAEMLSSDRNNEWETLDLSQKYFRTLIESATLASLRDHYIRNKQYAQPSAEA